MGRLRTIWAKLKGQAVQSREDDAFTDEIREHITLLTQHYRAQGMSAEDATRAARRQFGNVTQLKERQRWQRGMLPLLSGVAMCASACACSPKSQDYMRQW
jgi:hypothetical protein